MADQKLTELTETTSPASTDLAYVVVDPAGTPGSRKATLANTIAFHTGASDPHTGYRLESADHTHQSTGAQAGKIDHGAALDGLSDNDHPQYLLVADIDDTAVNGETAQPISSNWAFDHVAAADPHTGYHLESAGYILASITYLTSGTAATYNLPAGIRAIIVEAIGGGGGGGGADGAASNAGYAPGGSSGSWGRKLITSPNSSYEYTVGGGGAGGAAGNNAGDPGTDTTFGNPAVLTCQNGQGGSGSGTAGTSLTTIIGALGQTGSGGDINLQGGYGGGSIRLSGAAGISGAGGIGHYGGDARAVIAADGTDASIPGAGGAGAGTNGNTDRAGGDGAPGIIIIWEYK